MGNPTNTDGQAKGSGHYDRKPHSYTTQPATVPKYPTPEEDAESPEEPMPEDLDDAYDDRYYIGIINTVDESDRHLGVCFNCGRAGHQWHECTEPLKDSLKAAIDHLNCIRQNKNIRKPLNPNGGAGVKGAHIRQAAPAKANPASVQQ